VLTVQLGRKPSSMGCAWPDGIATVWLAWVAVHLVLAPLSAARAGERQRRAGAVASPPPSFVDTQATWRWFRGAFIAARLRSRSPVRESRARGSFIWS
jgi:hypothetical protein